MRRLLTWIVVTIGIAALVRRLRRRNQQDEAAVVAEEAEDDPADELRRKLAVSRSDEAVDEEPPAPEASVGERRAGVHEEGRSALEEMRGTDTGA